MLELELLTDEQQERMCELCARHIYGCTVNTGPHNLCEGSRCDQAIDYLQDEYDEERKDKLKFLLLIH